jgi:hypothetical protein
MAHIFYTAPLSSPLFPRRSLCTKRIRPGFHLNKEASENGHFMGNYRVFSVSSASSVVENILLIFPAAYQKHCDALGSGCILLA